MGYASDYPKPEKNYFGQVYNAFGFRSPGGRIVGDTHFIEKAKLKHLEDFENVVAEFNKRDDLFGSVKRIVLV